MFDFKNIKAEQQRMNDYAKELKNLVHVVFPQVNNAIIEKLQVQDRVIFQEFAKESGKILMDAFKMKDTEVKTAIEDLRKKYEQRINNEKGV